MISVIFDTSILIDFLRKNENAKRVLQKVENGEIKGYISSITEAELFSGKESLDENKKKAINDLIKLFEKILPNNEIARRAGELRRDCNISLLDCIIASTALFQNAKIWTKNIDDFKRIKQVEVEEPY